ncbi:MAG: trehalose-phosphatase [Methanobacterium sp.]
MHRYLFDNLDDLLRFKEDSNTAIITDIDGTISEIVPTPMEATVAPQIRETMEEMSDKFKFTGVMTGRSINNAREMMESDKLIYIGNHGLEQFKNGEITIEKKVKDYIGIIKKVAQSIQKELSEYGCVLFQDKELSFTVHYRLCDNPEEIRRIALSVISNIEESRKLKIAEGRMVIEIRPPIGDDKGTILQKFIHDNDIKKIIYLGDDITDSDAFRKLNELRNQGMVESFSIAVKSNETPEYVIQSANFYVNSVSEVHEFFKWLIN